MAKDKNTNSQKQKTRKLKPPKSILKKILHFLAITLFLTLSSLPITILSYHQTYTDKIYPGIYVGNISLGKKTFGEASRLTVSHFPPPSSRLILVSEGQIWEMPISEINLSFEATATAKKAYQFGRSGRLGFDLSSKWQAIATGVKLTPVYHYDQGLLDKKIFEFSALVDIQPVPSTLTVSGKKVVTTPSRAGRVLDQQKLLRILRHRFENLQLSEPISLPIINLKPTLNENRATQARQVLEKLISTPLILTFEEKSWTINASTALNFFLPISTTSAQTQLTYLVKEKGQVFANPLSETTPVRQDSLINAQILKDYFKGIALEIDKDPQDAVFHFVAGKVRIFKPSHEGQKLDIEKAIELTSKVLTDEQELADRNFKITLPVKITQPEVTTGEVNNLGIREFLGRGVSNFRGSIGPRVHNITLSAERLNGLLIAPGETFSFNESLGEVSSVTGYKQAYVIKRDRTILDDGGGVCQVSTTLFRAALDTGLPIIERTAHAYRVVYYERVYPVGFDATVYPPAVDLKFKNDTSAYILIQSSVDKNTNELIFELYGTSDGRTIELGKPVMTNQVPPSEPLHQEDSNLPKGEIKQIERPAWGANVRFSYKVTRGEEILQNTTFYSRYRPWGAVYLVGTKE
jgi:vancomycin resistance protein YoaR